MERELADALSRIKRLEEAGETLNQLLHRHVTFNTYFEFCQEDAKEWRKAKEATS